LPVVGDVQDRKQDISGTKNAIAPEGEPSVEKAKASQSQTGLRMNNFTQPLCFCCPVGGFESWEEL
jgi:hypothetical protein